MSDNLTTADGVVATDQLDFVNGAAQSDPKPHAQRTKHGYGADGDYKDVSEDSPLPVEVMGELVEHLSAVRFALLALNRSLGMSLPAVGGQMRVAIEAITGALTLATITTVGTVTTVTGVTTVATLTNQTNIGGNPANMQIPALMGIAADSLRNRITAS